MLYTGRVSHYFSDQGWVDFDLGFSVVCPILSLLMRVWQIGLSNCTRSLDNPNHGQPNPGLRGDALIIFL